MNAFDSVGLLQALLRAYSPTGEEAQAVNTLVEVLAQAGLRAEIDAAGNAVATRGEGPRELLLLGHIDTVPGFIEPRVEGDRLYGRGSVDAKGPLACFAAAAVAAEPPPGWQVTVIGAVGEEGDSRGAKYLAATRKPAEQVFIGEPSGWERVTLGYKGSVWFQAQFDLPVGHTAGAAGSACEAAVDFWNLVNSSAQTLNVDKERLFEQVTPTLRGMASASDGFTDSARLNIGVRTPPWLDETQFHAWVRGLSPNARLTIGEYLPAARTDKNNPLARALVAGIRQAGGAPGYTLKTGTSDMNIVGPAWGCPIVAYGPGDSALDHTPKEHILIPEFLSGVAALSAALPKAFQLAG